MASIYSVILEENENLWKQLTKERQRNRELEDIVERQSEKIKKLMTERKIGSNTRTRFKIVFPNKKPSEENIESLLKDIKQNLSKESLSIKSEVDDTVKQEVKQEAIEPSEYMENCKEELEDS